MSLFSFRRQPDPSPPPEATLAHLGPLPGPRERKEVELTFTTGRQLPDVCMGVQLCEFMFEQAMLDRNKPDENLRWYDIQAMVTRSIRAINALNPGLEAHTPMPVPQPRNPNQPPPEPPIGDEEEKPPVYHRRKSNARQLKL